MIVLPPDEGLSLLGRSPCMAEVVSGLVEDFVGDDIGVDVRPPVTSRTLLAAHCINEVRVGWLDIL